MSERDDGKTVRQQRNEYDASLFPKELDHSAWGKPHERYDTPHPEALSGEQFLKELTTTISQDAHSNVSPFLQCFFEKKISREGMKTWFKQWYYEARTFPPLVAQMVANCVTHYDARQFMATNLVEELGEFLPSREHPVLLRNVGVALGVPVAEMEFVTPIPEVLLYVEFRQKLIRDCGFIEALCAGALSIELTIPGRYKKIAAALKEQTGLDDKTLEFFYIHAGHPDLPNDYGGDVRHALEAGNLIKKYATTAAIQERCRQAVWRSLEARKVYHYGLFREIVLKDDPTFGKYFQPRER